MALWNVPVATKTAYMFVVGTDSCCLRGVCSCHVHGLPMVPLSSSPLHDIGCGLNLVSCRCAFCVVHRAFPTCCSAMLSLCYGWSAGHDGADISLNSQREIANLHLASILAAVCLPALGVFCVSLLGFLLCCPHVPHELCVGRFFAFVFKNRQAKSQSN